MDFSPVGPECGYIQKLPEGGIGSDFVRKRALTHCFVPLILSLRRRPSGLGEGPQGPQCFREGWFPDMVWALAELADLDWSLSVK